MSQYKKPDGFVNRNKERFDLFLDKDWSEREARLRILKMYLDSTIYDNLSPWYQEYQGGQSGSYVPLAKRRPCAIYNLCSIIVNESVSMLFSDDHFPRVRNDDNPEIEKFIHKVNDLYDINSLMLSAAYVGSLGSVCILVRVLNGTFYFEALDTYKLQPFFDVQNPKKMIRLIEKNKYDGNTLISYGYSIPEDDKHQHYLVIREWDENSEIYYLPVRCDTLDSKQSDQSILSQLEIDPARSSQHNFGFVPALWAKNSTSCGKIDGLCTFEGIVDISVEIDYQLSQLGRLLKYNSDPTLVIKNPSSLEGSQLIKSVGALNLDEKGDAYLLEMSNSSTIAVIDYVRCLREFALEVSRGNRANPDKMNAIHSGKALQMLNGALIGLCGELRICYGKGLLLPLYQMIFDIIKSGQVEIKDDLPVPDKMENLILDWPGWYPPTPQDDLQEMQAIQTVVVSGVISSETATKTVADKYNIIDIDEEISKIDKESEKMLDKTQNTMVKGKTIITNSSKDSVDR